MKKLRGALIKFLRRLNKRLTIPKRQLFIITTIVLTVGLLTTQLVSIDFRYRMVAILSCITFLLTAFALRDDLRGIEWMTLLTLPTAFTAGISLFYFLLPVRWLTRLPIVFGYAVGVYALLLTENIFSVAKNRTIALLRAAHSVGFLLTVASFFLVTQTVLAYRFEIIYQTIILTIMTFPLILQSLWSMELDSTFSNRTKAITVVITAVLVQISWVFYFWPINQTLLALLLTTIFYSLVGMGQQYLISKLYKRTVIEFISVTIIVCIVVLLASRWRGGM